MNFKSLRAYESSFDLCMRIFETTKCFLKEEAYCLTDQIKQSSRSVTVTIAKSYRKRRYPKHFISKLTGSDSENSETQTWLEFALAYKYIDPKTHNELMLLSKDARSLINNPDKFGVKE